MDLNSNKHPWLKKPIKMLRDIVSAGNHFNPQPYMTRNTIIINDEDEMRCPNCYSHLVHCKEDRYSCPNCGYQYLDR